MKPIRISGKNLGQLALDYCPRCFWLKLKCQHRLPFAIFPGIFSSIDSFSKRVTAAHFAKRGKAPSWFADFGGQELVAVPHHSKFFWQDPATEVLLTGAPDELVRKADKSLVILDYKTSKFTENQDALLPLYCIQLNSYAFICEKIGMGKVSALALIYFEPMTEVGADNVASVVRDDGFNMRFVAKVLPVELAMDTIPPLLARVRKIYDLQYPPAGRPGCKDCQLLDGLVELLTSPLPNDERERLKGKLSELREWFEFSMFERGLFFQEAHEHRLAVLNAERSAEKKKSEQRRLRLEIAAVERQLRG